MFYKNLDLRTEYRNKMINFIRNNPQATHKDIRKKLRIHPERVFKKGMAEAFKDAGVKLPRTFGIKSKYEKREIIADYINENPGVGGHTIAKDTKINVSSVFNNIQEAYKLAGVKYPRVENTKLKKRKLSERKKEIINLVRKNPLVTISEIHSKVKTQSYHIFKNMEEIYYEAGVRAISRSEKRRIKKKSQIINFIKKNPLATQREINMACKTHVQLIFKKGIFEAYERADVKFPYERLKLYGIGVKEIRERARNFEDEVAIKLSGYGKVNRLVKTKSGIADIIFERKGKKAIIEIKDYQKKDISISQIKQLNKYLTDCSCDLGLLICHKKPKKDRFLIGRNKIFVLENSEINKIPKIIEGSVV